MDTLKKKLVYRKKRRLKTSYDKHHLFWIRNEWNKGELEKLRVHPYCIIEINRDTVHRYLHNHLAYIPVPKECAVERILFQLKCLEQYGAISSKDSIEKRLSVLIALFECSEQPTADALKEQLRLVHEFYNKKAPI